MARKGSHKAFLCLLPAAFSRFPSISFITHLCLHLALSGFALTLLSEFTLLPFLCFSALLPIPLAFSGLISPFYIPVLLSGSLYFPRQLLVLSGAHS